jgi:cell division protein FtsB
MQSEAVPQPNALKLILVLLLGCQLAIFSLILLETKTASAQSDNDLRIQKDLWQGNYRKLLRNRVTLEENITKLNKGYAQAQRRNYPRGGAREKFRIQAEEARTELKKVEAAIAAIFEDARRQGVSQNWLYEVDDETIKGNQPASPKNRSDDDDRAGRNPLYFDDKNR